MTLRRVRQAHPSAQGKPKCQLCRRPPPPLTLAAGRVALTVPGSGWPALTSTPAQALGW